MSDVNVYFNGHDLTSLFVVGDVERSFPAWSATLENVPGDGKPLIFTELDVLEITLTCSFNSDNREVRRNALHTLAGWLRVDEPKRLEFADEPDKYYMALPNGKTKSKYWQNADAVEIKFVCPSPAMYGETHTATLPSGGSVTLDVAGTYPTTFEFSGKATPDELTGRYGIRHVQTGDWIHVKTTGENIPIHWIEVDGDKWGDVKNETWGEMHVDSWKDATHAIIIADSEVDIWSDTGQRIVRINDAFTTPTLDSNWIVLEPGEQTIVNDLGMGDVEITWTDRWL